MDEKGLKPKYEAPRIVLLEELRSSIGGGEDAYCTRGNNAIYDICSVGSGGIQGGQCQAGSNPT